MNRLSLVLHAQRLPLARRAARGFTLLEMLVVIALIALLATVVGTKVIGVFGTQKTKIAQVQIQELDKNLNIFKLDVGRYPTTAEGLQALVTKPASASGWNGPYMSSIPLDPWNNPYRYASPGPNGGVEILSLGGDNNPGGEGENADVRNAP
jgi:general secretion pathway protein G